MRFDTFIENRYQEVTLKMRTDSEREHNYNIWTDAETKALHQLLDGFRLIIKWAFMPVILGRFIGVHLKLIIPPEPVLINKLKAQKKEEEQKAKERANEARETVLKAVPGVSNETQPAIPSA